MVFNIGERKVKRLDFKKTKNVHFGGNIDITLF
jgi:hypothetical protein